MLESPLLSWGVSCLDHRATADLLAPTPSYLADHRLDRCECACRRKRTIRVQCAGTIRRVLESGLQRLESGQVGRKCADATEPFSGAQTLFSSRGLNALLKKMRHQLAANFNIGPHWIGSSSARTYLARGLD
ncbi:hypothetical protein B0H13DRAFT_1929628 [Mycena leptocephala]|nr:hypothetical protein B0H13DRAFT_1929628 [Mycena leptocephala]